MDANEYGLKVTPAAQSLAVLLNRAEWHGEDEPAAKEKTQPGSLQPAEPVVRQAKTSHVNGDEIVMRAAATAAFAFAALRRTSATN